ncbi:MAG: hypothetical protein M1483_04665 [Actinobacteria bacterium]|nr:hypothetical protein [Actinomycetota bacterium]MCL6104905.1 hypothetical protein [Actinomycetota bacterium]
MRNSWLKPLSFGELLDVSVKLTVNSLASLLRIALYTLLPALVLFVVLLFSAIPRSIYNLHFPTASPFSLNQSSGTASPFSSLHISSSSVWGLIGAVSIGMVILSIASLLFAYAACLVLGNNYMRIKFSWKDALVQALRRLASLFWIICIMFTVLLAIWAVLLGIITLLYGIVAHLAIAVRVLMGFLGFDAVVGVLVLSIYLPVSWTLFMQFLAFEDKRGQHAISHSFRLTKKRWWQTFGILIVAYLIVSAASGALGYIVALPLGLFLHNFVVEEVIIFVLNTAGSAISISFIVAVLTVVYFDLKVRKEALDLQLLVAGMGSSPSGQRPTFLTQKPYSPGYGPTMPPPYYNPDSPYPKDQKR